ncbi:MAG: thiamine phosphate synthase [Muribaculaceae bacterium]|nr:thiamine phosphate synthase [Muribaculaceae bacterium]
MLQFITHKTARYDEIEGAVKALEGGCRWIQLRMKDASVDVVEKTARQLLPVCRQYGAKLILDDHVDLVIPTGADGVHLGKMDLPVAEARKILGEEYIIGATANNYGDIIKAIKEGADYIGLGPYRYTTTKKKLSSILGLEGYHSILEKCHANNIHIPIVAIGGITLDDIELLKQTGILGVAVSGCVLSADDPSDYTRKLLEALDKDSMVGGIETKL